MNQIKTYILLFVTILILPSCMSAAIISTAAIATKIISDSRSIKNQIDDHTLQIRITYALSKDKILRQTARIVHTTYKGKTLLVGQAPTTDLIKRAQKLVMTVNGLTEIYNEIRKGEPISLISSSEDTWISAKIQLELLGNKKIKLSNIKIVTENREVFLLGLVTHEEETEIIHVINNIQGVKHIVTIFTYIK